MKFLCVFAVLSSVVKLLPIIKYFCISAGCLFRDHFEGGCSAQNAETGKSGDLSFSSAPAT